MASPPETSAAQDAAQAPGQLTYPPFESSPYVASGTTRRERWWFSDGIWLDQGQTADVVGFAWTHWLADRGVIVRGAELGADFATQLQREGQVLGGLGLVGPDSGVQAEAVVRVVQSRGLLERCYSFGSVDSVVDALLERGPVLASIAWRSAMFTPADVDGWSVCRAGADDHVAGGYYCLLNGVALDLVIDGVTGFVRLKNTWGRQWADEGQALISIADLGAVLDPGRTLLPIPNASVLRTGIRPDVAVEGPPYRPRQVRFEQSSIAGDVATRRDIVGAAAYAEAIARGIQHPDTKAPLTIGIKAPWGAGKTSLMRMIRDRLEWPELDGSSENLRHVHLTTAAARRVSATARKSAVTGPEALGTVTNRAVLRKLKDAGEEPAPGELKADLGKAGVSAPPRDHDRWRPTVWFNPWMYQTGEQVWAGLANEIIEQVTERMTRGEREHFWLHLNRARVDEQAVRRKVYGLVLSRVLPWAAFGLVLLAGGIVALIAGRLGPAGGWSVTLAGPAVILAGGTVAGWRALGSHVGAGLHGLVRPATGARELSSGQLAGAYSELVVSPDYRAQAGYLYLVHTDIRRVLDLVATPDRPLVIFVDDLDRCSPGTVVQVIEAINIFVSGTYPNCVFVIAMEPEMVAAHIEAAYSSLVHQLADTPSSVATGPGLGWRFLEKIVQLPLALPTMEPETTVPFIESLFPAVRAADTAEAAPDTQASQGDDGAAAAALRTASLSEAVSIAGIVRPDAAVGRELRRVIERRLVASDPEVRQVIEYAGGALNRNPREIKRFVNLFRFYTMIYAERKLANLPTVGSLHEVAKLAVLGIRWPSLLGCLGQPVRDGSTGPMTVIELLERPPDNDDEVRGVLKAAGINETTISSLLAPELASFLRAEPFVGRGMHGYF